MERGGRKVGVLVTGFRAIVEGSQRRRELMWMYDSPAKSAMPFVALIVDLPVLQIINIVRPLPPYSRARLMRRVGRGIVHVGA